MRGTVSGIDLRIVQGSKAPDDLRLDAHINGEWVPLRMELAFFLVDFFAENEQALKAHRSFWKENGDAYFMKHVIQAWKEGWKVPAMAVRNQRARRGAA